MDFSSDNVDPSNWEKQHLDWLIVIRKKRLDEELIPEYNILLLLLTVGLTCNTPAALDRRDPYTSLLNEQLATNGRKSNAHRGGGTVKWWKQHRPVLYQMGQSKLRWSDLIRASCWRRSPSGDITGLSLEVKGFGLRWRHLRVVWDSRSGNPVLTKYFNFYTALIYF